MKVITNPMTPTPETELRAELERVKAELGITRDDLRDEQCAARSDRQLYETTKAELERVNKANAEMREALVYTKRVITQGGYAHSSKQIEDALSTSAGTGYFSREQVMPLALGLQAVESLINESRGVIGLHLNGDEAAWESLRSTGRYEEWLLDFDKALNHARTIGLLKEDA